MDIKRRIELTIHKVCQRIAKGETPPEANEALNILLSQYNKEVERLDKEKDQLIEQLSQDLHQAKVNRMFGKKRNPYKRANNE